MHKHRFYILPKNIVNNITSISLPEYHHIIDVLRYKEGDPIVLFDGKGNEYVGRVTSINKKIKSLEAYIEKVEREEIPRPLILVQSLVKSMDIIIQKATELGVTHVYPMITKNSVVKLEPEEQIRKINKWRRITEEASKQCRRNWLPYIDKIWNLNEVLDSLDWVDLRIICAIADKARSLKDITDENKGSIAVMIGPEGDFTKEELDSAFSRGWLPVCLGKNVLRAETADISVLSIMCYKFGYWD